MLDAAFCDAWDNLAVCYRRMGRYDDAFNAGIRSLMIDSTNVTAGIFKKIYSKFKDNPELNYFLGKCLSENENDTNESQKYIDKALEPGYVIENETNNRE